jgi:hypothetical protein
MSTNNISFKFKNIEIVEFSFVHPKQIFPENAMFRFETNIEHKVNFDEKVIIVVSSFVISCDDLNEKVGNAVVSCVYSVENLDDFVDENNVFILPDNFISMFNSISISTCRGVLFTLFRGTPLHSVILPIINLTDINKKQL